MAGLKRTTTSRSLLRSSDPEGLAIYEYLKDKLKLPEGTYEFTLKFKINSPVIVESSYYVSSSAELKSESRIDDQFSFVFENK